MLTTNFYFWIILASLLGFHALDTIASLLNLKTLRRSLPDEFKGIYDETEYRRLLDYTAVTTRFEIFTSTFNLAVLLTFWFCGGYNLLDQFVPSGRSRPDSDRAFLHGRALVRTLADQSAVRFV